MSKEECGVFSGGEVAFLKVAIIIIIIWRK